MTDATTGRDQPDGQPTTDETVRLGRFVTASGGEIPSLRVAYTTYGTNDGDNAVLVCHPLTASHRPAGGSGPFDGWWESVVGPGKPIDTDEWFVVCANVLGSPHGSSAPNRVGPDGTVWGSDFPAVGVGDWTRAQRRLADHLGVDRWAAVVGGSVGGMNALEWVRRYPDRVSRAVVVAAGARLDPQCLALDAVARRAITDDPAWHGGDYHETRDRPTDGLAQARRIGHVMYLSKASMRRKFGRRPARAVLDAVGDETDGAGGDAVDGTGGESADGTGGESADGAGGEETAGGVTGGVGRLGADRGGPGTYRAVESYLDYNAERFARRFDPACYLALLRAMDEYDLAAGGGFGTTTGADGGGAGRPGASSGGVAEALSGFDGSLRLVSFTGDWHFTVEQSRRLADAAASVGVDTTHHRIDSQYGHDAFLVEPNRLVEPLGEALDRGGSPDAWRVGRPDGRRYRR